LLIALHLFPLLIRELPPSLLARLPQNKIEERQRRRRALSLRSIQIDVCRPTLFVAARQLLIDSLPKRGKQRLMKNAAWRIDLYKPKRNLSNFCRCPGRDRETVRCTSRHRCTQILQGN
jgi:hypothetical protein